MAVSWGEAQAAVIGSGLIDAACVPQILAEMRPEDFNGAFLRFFEAFRALTAEQKPIDPVIVLSRLGAEYRDAAKELMDATPTSANVAEYIKICKEQSRLRLLRDVGEDLAQALTLADAKELMQKAAAVSLETGTRDRATAMELAADWINAINANEKPEFITSGIGCLDQVIHTVPGNYHIIAGYTSHGKSTLALQIAQHIAKTRKVGYFSLELKRSEFRDKLIAMKSGADSEHVQSRELTEEELQTTGRAAGEIFAIKENLAYEPASGFTVDDIRAVTLQYGYEVIFVDYLQSVAIPAHVRGERFQGVAEISRSLQQLAYSLGVVVFAMSQLTDQTNDDDFLPVPTLSNLRESRQIGMDADAVVFIHAPLRKPMPHFHVLDIAKNRSGRTERFFIDFDGSRQKFVAPSPLDYRLWGEIMRKRRMLKADERDAIKAEHDADMKRRLENEQRKRHQAERGEGTQMNIEEVKA